MSSENVVSAGTERGHDGEQLLGMAAARLEQMAELREVRIDGIEQPEVGDIGDGEFGQALVLLAAHAGEHAAARGEIFDQPAGDGDQIIAGGNVQQRGDEVRVELVGFRFGLSARARCAGWNCPGGSRPPPGSACFCARPVPDARWRSYSHHGRSPLRPGSGFRGRARPWRRSGRSPDRTGWRGRCPECWNRARKTRRWAGPAAAGRIRGSQRAGRPGTCPALDGWRRRHWRAAPG